MSVRTVQTCEQCGRSRELRKGDSPDAGGWRTLSTGSLEATLCADDVRDVVLAAREAAKGREASDA